jgi:hypothetical protein
MVFVVGLKCDGHFWLAEFWAAMWPTSEMSPLDQEF